MAVHLCNPDYLASTLETPNTTGMENATAPHNAAAWALEPKKRPLVVSSAPYKSPPPLHVTIKVHSVSVNPIDWINQNQDVFHAQYPAIFGLDIAGTVEECGEGTFLVEKGQRVIA